MGLAPASRPAKTHGLPDMGALSEAQREELFRRHALLGKLAEQDQGETCRWIKEVVHDLKRKPDALFPKHIHTQRPLGHVFLEPLQHRLWAALELKVAVPAGGGAVDPLQFLLDDGNVVEYGLYVARLR